MNKEEKIKLMEKTLRLFPNLEPWNLEIKQELQKKLFEEIDGKNQEYKFMQSSSRGKNDLIPAGYTYLGQLIAHDISFDPFSLSSLMKNRNVVNNQRTPTLDLDSVFAGGPFVNPMFYTRINKGNSDRIYFNLETIEFQAGEEKVFGYDFLRIKNNKKRGVAIIPDNRNDEHILISQLQVAVQIFHNKIIDRIHDKYEKIITKQNVEIDELWLKISEKEENNILANVNKYKLRHGFESNFVLENGAQRIIDEVTLVSKNFKKKFQEIEILASCFLEYLRKLLNFNEGSEVFRILENLRKIKDISILETLSMVNPFDINEDKSILFENQDNIKAVLDQFQKLTSLDIVEKVNILFSNIIKQRTELFAIKEQFHLSVVSFYEKLPELVFFEAQKVVIWHFQWLVLWDYLPRVIGHCILNDVIKRNDFDAIESHRKIFFWDENPFIPLEFSVSAFRFGHSMVRSSYTFNPNINDGLFSENIKEFNSPPKTFVEWKCFFKEKNEEPDRCLNFSNPIDFLIDPLMLQGLVNLEGSKNIVQRNIVRSKFKDIPSGQKIARLLNSMDLTDVIIDGSYFKKNAPKKYHNLSRYFPLEEELFKHFCDNSPLWFYILMEAHLLEHGERLGPVGGRIVAEVLIGIIEGDKNSFLYQQPDWRPDFFDDCEVETPGDFTMVDLLKIAGVWKGAYVKEKDDCKPSNT